MTKLLLILAALSSCGYSALTDNFVEIDFNSSNSTFFDYSTDSISFGASSAILNPSGATCDFASITVKTAYGIPFVKIKTFTEIPDTNCFNARYVLSPDGGTKWYCVKEGEWTEVSGTGLDSANTAEEINAYIENFSKGGGLLTIRAFLTETGCDNPEIEKIIMMADQDIEPDTWKPEGCSEEGGSGENNGAPACDQITAGDPKKLIPHNKNGNPVHNCPEAPLPVTVSVPNTPGETFEKEIENCTVAFRIITDVAVEARIYVYINGEYFSMDEMTSTMSDTMILAAMGVDKNGNITGPVEAEWNTTGTPGQFIEGTKGSTVKFLPDANGMDGSISISALDTNISTGDYSVSGFSSIAKIRVLTDTTADADTIKEVSLDGSGEISGVSSLDVTTDTTMNFFVAAYDKNDSLIKYIDVYWNGNGVLKESITVGYRKKMVFSPDNPGDG
ncbi:MAG: hypothetical protein ACLFQK_02430 [Fibrobacterota bacterium]